MKIKKKKTTVFIIKKWNNVIYSNMVGPWDCHTEWTKWKKSESKTNIIWYHLYVESKINGENESFSKT